MDLFTIDTKGAEEEGGIIFSNDEDDADDSNGEEPVEFEDENKEGDHSSQLDDEASNTDAETSDDCGEEVGGREEVEWSDRSDEEQDSGGIKEEDNISEVSAEPVDRKMNNLFEESSDEEEIVKVSKRFQLFSNEPRKSERQIVKPKKNVFDFSEVYINFDMDSFGQTTATETLQSARKSEVDELLAKKSIAHQPGFNQLDCLPHSDLSKKKARKIRQIEREKSKGDKWFNMPATEVTEEVKRDLEMLQMRSALDPKTFYKKNDLKVLPKYFQIGRVVDNAADFYHSRIPKKDRKRTMVDELLADAEFQQRSKKKYKEIVAEKQQTHHKAHRQAKKLKGRKK
ncbi:deoxynucleotidyltransferase terminal-interacting protein 2 isoform X2 [Neocloeon triangulifer]|nr:deoxynucleotidyltransferase terminal-interacting protein 2 isoform X2 [Neocloeon triangulifer]